MLLQASFQEKAPAHPRVLWRCSSPSPDEKGTWHSLEERYPAHKSQNLILKYVFKELRLQQGPLEEYLYTWSFRNENGQLIPWHVHFAQSIVMQAGQMLKLTVIFYTEGNTVKAPGTVWLRHALKSCSFNLKNIIQAATPCAPKLVTWHQV